SFEQRRNFPNQTHCSPQCGEARIGRYDRRLADRAVLLRRSHIPLHWRDALLADRMRRTDRPGAALAIEANSQDSFDCPPTRSALRPRPSLRALDVRLCARQLMRAGDAPDFGARARPGSIGRSAPAWKYQRFRMSSQALRHDHNLGAPTDPLFAGRLACSASQDNEIERPLRRSLSLLLSELVRVIRATRSAWFASARRSVRTS